MIHHKVTDKIPYKYMPENIHVKKNFRDEEGIVVTGPRNFTTMNPKKGKVGKNTYFGGAFKHLPEDPDA